jgi:NAD(P)-dependent dehydrogenase (short-subunit alcohol dehydrogenase family)
MQLEGIAVVTGGASGIGEACCRHLARSGATVVVLDRDGGKAEKVARAVGGRGYQSDVGEEKTLRASVARIEAEVGPVDMVVNSAGILQFPARPNEVSMDVWDDIVRVDQRGTYLGCVAFGERMVQRRRGSIVNIASIAGMRSMPLHAYAPAKAAVIAITQCLAAEWGPAQVRVNSVSPGFTLTPALQAAIDRGERDVSKMVANAALGRMVVPDDIAKAVAFLASPEAAAITGANLPVDCGWLVTTSWNTYGGLRPPGN